MRADERDAATPAVTGSRMGLRVMVQHAATDAEIQAFWRRWRRQSGRILVNDPLFFVLLQAIVGFYLTVCATVFTDARE